MPRHPAEAAEWELALVMRRLHSLEIIGPPSTLPRAGRRGLPSQPERRSRRIRWSSRSKEPTADMRGTAPRADLVIISDIHSLRWW